MRTYKQRCLTTVSDEWSSISYSDCQEARLEQVCLVTCNYRTFKVDLLGTEWQTDSCPQARGEVLLILCHLRTFMVAMLGTEWQTDVYWRLWRTICL